MLALKELQVVDHKTPRRYLLDLPDELLDLAIDALHADSGKYVREIIPVSLTCRRLRTAVLPILFRTLHIRVTNRYVDKRTFNIFLNLNSFPYDFARHVRCLKQDDNFCFRDSGCEDLNLSNELVRRVVKQGLCQLINLKSIIVGCLNSPILNILPALFPKQPFLIQIEACGCSPWNARSSPSFTQALCDSEVPHHFAVATSSTNRHVALSPWNQHNPTKTLAICWTQSVTQNLNITPKDELSIGCFTSLKELHLKGSDATMSQEFTMMQIFPVLENLERLSLVGPALCSAALGVVNKLTKLESLRLNSNLDRIFHAHLRNHDFEGLPYLKLPHLKSLEIRYISRYLSIEHVVPKSIRHLRIEYHNRNERLTLFDLRWIARQAPGLECLEINTGALANLWHPTAIAGVDVDMEVYGMLETLSSFRNLTTVRLFPSYWQSLAGYLHFVQPVADEQAVRIYNHLRLQCRKLRLLIISNSYLDYRSRNEVFSRGLSEPMKWVVRSHGGRTLLTTHEAKKSYRLEQIWEGDRRLTMTTARQNGRKLHFDELQEWILPAYEFPFDEPQPCHAQAMDEIFDGRPEDDDHLA